MPTMPRASACCGAVKYQDLKEFHGIDKRLQITLESGIKQDILNRMEGGVFMIYIIFYLKSMVGQMTSGILYQLIATFMIK